MKATFTGTFADKYFDERTCDMTNSKFVLRNLNTHLVHLDLIKKSPDLTTQYGVKAASVLLKVKDF
jgi:hypothetical protein